MTASTIPTFSLTEAADLIRKRKLSPVELTEACLQRISALDAHLRAFITVTRQEALASAQKAETAIAQGNYKGPLHGIPFALKDLFDTAGVLTTAGSRVLAERVPREDAAATERLKSAGMALLGKLNLHEFAFGATGVNPHFGATRNPWGSERISGGSSSGSAAAVAAGMALGALGTDTGGSVRIPASLCGITGLKPTYGRVSRHGVVTLSWSLDHVGPMARTAADCALILQAIAGHDPRDETSGSEGVPDYAEALEWPPLKRLRIGVPDGFFFENTDPEVVSAVEEAVATLERAGAQVNGISLPRIAEVPHAVNGIMMPEATAFHQRWLAERPDDYGDELRGRLETGLLFPATVYVNAQRFRSLIVEEWRQTVFQHVDLLATPTTAVAAPALAEADLQTTITLVRLTNPFNLTGLPAISVPCGFTSAGLPIGLQLVGRWWEEGTVLRAAHAYQQVTDWHKRTPPL